MYSAGKANKLYLLPKVHKVPPGVRPINASHKYFLNGIDQYVAVTLADKFGPFLMSKSVLRDTPHFLAELYDFKNIPNDVLVSTIDVEALYPSLSRPHLLEVFRDVLPSKFGNM